MAATAQEQDIGVVIKWQHWVYCLISSQKRSDLSFAITRKGMECKPEIIFLLLCKSVVQLYLEYCIEFWVFHLKLDIVES